MLQTDNILETILKELGEDHYLELQESQLNNADEYDARTINYSIYKRIPTNSTNRFIRTLFPFNDVLVIQLYSCGFGQEPEYFDMSRYPSTNSARRNLELALTDVRSGRRFLDISHYVFLNEHEVPDTVKKLLQKNLWR